MTRDDNPAFTHIVESWLDSPDAFLDPDIVLDRVLEQVETRPQRRARWPEWRIPFMNRTVPIIVAAAAVLVIGIIGFNALGGGGDGLGGPDVDPNPTATPESSVTEPSPSVDAGLPVGSSHTLSDEGVLITATIPAPGWSDSSGFLVKDGNGHEPDGAFVIGVWVGPDPVIPGDPCQWESTMPETPASTLDEIVAALGGQATRNASAAEDVTVDGYAGMVITIETPDGPYSASGNPDCDQDQFCTLGFGDPTVCHMWYQEAGQFDELWIVDVDGEFVFAPGSYYSETPASVIDELGAFLGSMTFGE